MTKALKTKIMCYVTSIVINAWLVLSYVRSHDVGTLPLVDQYHVWCDAFFLPGVGHCSRRCGSTCRYDTYCKLSV